MSEPRRVQLLRTKGWRMPENTVSVARPGQYGNPFKVGEFKAFINDDDPTDKVLFDLRTIEECVAAFRWLAEQPKNVAVIRRDLAGKNLACWCRLGQPCHADVLLELANGPAMTNPIHATRILDVLPGIAADRATAERVCANLGMTDPREFNLAFTAILSARGDDARRGVLGEDGV